MTVWSITFLVAVALVDIIAVIWVVRWLMSSKPRQECPACARCANAGYDRAAEFIHDGEWMCGPHFDAILREHEAMAAEGKRQHRDAILDGGVWSRRLAQRSAELRRKNGQ